ncbi:MAG TPA: hypothetical protein VF653_10045 [Methylomirabilota bacterium]
MLPRAPVAITALFVAIVAAMLVLSLAGAGWAARRVGPAARRGVRLAAVGLVGWLGLTAVLAAHGFFADFQSLPPHMLLAIGLPLLSLLALVFSRAAEPWLAALPRAWPVAAQSFRIAVEIVLWRLAAAGVAPEIMTFTGRNVDILVGLTAPVVAYVCFVRGGWPARVAAWWNVAGILILLNVVVHAQLSAPTPFRVFETEPPTTFIGHVPYIWLPAFLVPLAWLLHGVSLRQLRLAR